MSVSFMRSPAVPVQLRNLLGRRNVCGGGKDQGLTKVIKMALPRQRQLISRRQQGIVEKIDARSGQRKFLLRRHS